MYQKLEKKADFHYETEAQTSHRKGLSLWKGDCRNGSPTTSTAERCIFLLSQGADWPPRASESTGLPPPEIHQRGLLGAWITSNFLFLILFVSAYTLHIFLQSAFFAIIIKIKDSVNCQIEKKIDHYIN